MSKKIIKKPLFVDVYEKIYDMILNGEMKPGDKLPGEVSMAKTFKVSRGTLRQSLLILQENGIIYNKQGTGNFISTASNKFVSGLERLSPIPTFFSKEKLKDKLINVIFEIPNSYIKKALNIDNSSLIMSCHKEYSINDTVCCYSLFQTPNSVLSEFNLNLDDKDLISKFVDFELLNHAAKSNVRIVFTQAGEFLSDILSVPLNTHVVMFEETLYDAQGNELALNRHSILPKYFDFSVNRSKL